MGRPRSASFSKDHDISEVFCNHADWQALILGAILLVGLLQVALRMRPGAAPTKFQREASVALTSGVVYMLLAIPLFIPALWGMMTPNLQTSYFWMPSWYAFVLSKDMGTFYETGSASILGTLVGAFAMCLLNYLTPGGANADVHSEYLAQHLAWIPGGYRPLWAYLFTAGYVYLVFLSTWNFSMKQYALGLYASVIVGYMDPDSTSDNSVILWDYEFRINWTGPVVSSVCIALAAVPLAALSLPVYFFCYRRWRRFFSCRAQASRGLAKVTKATLGTLARLIAHFRSGSRTLDVQSTHLYVRQLGERRTELKALIEQAQWECWNKATRDRLRGLRKVDDLLCSLRQVLRVQLEQLEELEHLPKDHNGDRSRCTPEVLQQLAVFEKSCKAFGDFIAFDALQMGLTWQVRAAMEAISSRAESAIVVALEHIPEARPAERVFLEGLQTFAQLLLRFSRDEPVLLWEQPEYAGPPRVGPCTCLRALWAQHLQAMRNTTSWLLALHWSRLTGRGTCVSTVCFLFSPSLGSLFDRNINRLVGTGLGLTLGLVPSAMLSACLFSPAGRALYLMLMFMQWSTAIYGYLATGSKYAYACLLWASFGGVTMLVGINQDSITYSRLFKRAMDDTIGCLIVFLVDILSARLCGARTRDMVDASIIDCFQVLRDLLAALRAGDFEGSAQLLQALKAGIAESRYWHQETQKEDHVWTSVRLKPYKAALVHDVLERLDSAQVAAWAMQSKLPSSAGSVGAAQAIIREELPRHLEGRCALYGDVLHKALNETRRTRAVIGEQLCGRRTLTTNGGSVAWQSFCTTPGGLPHEFSRGAVSEGPAEHGRFDTRDDLLAEDSVGALADAPMTLRTSAKKLYITLRRLQVMLQEHTILRTSDADTEESLKRRRATHLASYQARCKDDVQDVLSPRPLRAAEPWAAPVTIELVRP